MQGNARVWRCRSIQQNFRNKDACSVLQCWDLLGFAKPGRKPTILEETKHQTFKIIFFQLFLICIQMCANVHPGKWGTPLWRGSSFMWSHEPGVLSVADDTIGYGEFTTAINPSNAPAMLLQCCNIHLFSCTCKSAVADCGTINYLTRH